MAALSACTLNNGARKRTDLVALQGAGENLIGAGAIVVREHVDQSLHVLELGRQTRPHNVVAPRHDLQRICVHTWLGACVCV